MEKAESDTLGVSPPAFAGNPRTNAFSMASVTALPFNPLLLSVANSHTDSSPSSTGYEEYGDVAYGTVARAQDVDQLKAIILAAEAGTGEVARAIQDAMFTPRHNAFTSLLQLASKSRQPEKAVEIFEAMRSVAGIEPNTYSYSALISALARVGNWQDAEKYFHELKLKSNRDPAMRPNTVTYAALISGECCSQILQNSKLLIVPVHALRNIIHSG